MYLISPWHEKWRIAVNVTDKNQFNLLLRTCASQTIFSRPLSSMCRSYHGRRASMEIDGSTSVLLLIWNFVSISIPTNRIMRSPSFVDSCHSFLDGTPNSHLGWTLIYLAFCRWTVLNGRLDWWWVLYGITRRKKFYTFQNKSPIAFSRMPWCNKCHDTLGLPNLDGLLCKGYCCIFFRFRGATTPHIPDLCKTDRSV